MAMKPIATDEVRLHFTRELLGHEYGEPAMRRRAELMFDDWLEREKTKAQAEALRSLASMQEKAFNEGFDRGFYDPLAGGSRDASESTVENPYTKGSK